MQWTVLVGAIGLFLGATVATWHFVGDQSTTAPDKASYVLHPIPISPQIEHAAGIGGIAMTIGAASWLTWAAVQHGYDLRWWLVFGPALAAAMLIGLAWRVMTAGGIDANIGAGILVLIGGPVLLILLAWAIGYGIYLASAANH